MTVKFVIMGVSGCGKSSVGEGLKEQLALTFVDGDSLHPEANIQKMSRGVPLTDEDRAPWLARVGRTLGGFEQPAVIGCSSLKRFYRDIIRENAESDVGFLHLFAPKPILKDRVNARKGHFMPPALLESQFEDLEHLQADETGVLLDITLPLQTVIENAKDYIESSIEMA